MGSARSHTKLRRTPRGAALLDRRCAGTVAERTATAWLRQLDRDDGADVAGHEAELWTTALVRDALSTWPPPPQPQPRPASTHTVKVKIQVVRLPNGAVTTLTNPRFDPVECLGCGELRTIAGYGVCLSCRGNGWRYEVVQ